MNPSPIAQLIRELCQQPDWRGHHPYDVNDGQCEEFAFELIQLAENRGIRLDAHQTPSRSRYTGHVWVYDPSTGLHHDAEELGGVKRWTNLPIFARARYRG